MTPPLILRSLLLLCLLTGNAAYGQHANGIKLNYISPTGDLGFTHKKSLGLEYDHMNDFDGIARFRAGAAVHYLPARQDTIRTYTVEMEQSAPFTVSPSYRNYRFYLSVQGFVGFDCEIAKTGFYAGADVLFGGVVLLYTEEGGGFFGLQPVLGVRPHVGYEFLLNRRRILFVEASRNYSKVFGWSNINYTEIGLGIRF